MAHTFKNISAKPTFENLRQDLCQSDYINRKKSINTFCKSSYNKVIPSYDKMYLYNLGRILDKTNKSNLIMGQYSKMDLTDVSTVLDINASSNPEQIPFYFNHMIDPQGQLFGKSQCGELNYTQYMVYYNS